jgi:uncharacterized protein YxeA
LYILFGHHVSCSCFVSVVLIMSAFIIISVEHLYTEYTGSSSKFIKIFVKPASELHNTTQRKKSLGNTRFGKLYDVYTLECTRI